MKQWEYFVYIMINWLARRKKFVSFAIRLWAVAIFDLLVNQRKNDRRSKHRACKLRNLLLFVLHTDSSVFCLLKKICKKKTNELSYLCNNKTHGNKGYTFSYAYDIPIDVPEILRHTCIARLRCSHCGYVKGQKEFCTKK